jgi:hypothetical protein
MTIRIEDLPNGGRNLRVYTYDPPGTPYYKPGGYIYNTGHYDLCLAAGPCSQPDPQGFNDWGSMSAYVQSRNEFGLMLVTRDDLNVICAIPPKGTGTLYARSCGTGGIALTAAGATVPDGGTPTSGTITATDFSNLSPSVQSTVSAAIAPQLTPGTVGSVPSTTGGAVDATGAPTMLYRFILHDPTNPDGPWSTGANYPGCSQVNLAPCDAQAFQTEQEAIDYALERGETPYLVNSAGEVWAILGGSVAIDPKRILGHPSGISLPLILAAALGLWYISGR